MIFRCGRALRLLSTWSRPSGVWAKSTRIDQDPGAARVLDRLEPARDRRLRLEAPNDGLFGDTEGERHPRCTQHVAKVVFTDVGRPDSSAPVRGLEFESGLLRVEPGLFRGDVHARFEAERQPAIAGQPFVNDLPVRIVGVDDPRAVGGEMSLEQARLGLPVVLEVKVEIEVLG
jgi:hypothetical protein